MAEETGAEGEVQRDGKQIGEKCLITAATRTSQTEEEQYVQPLLFVFI